MNQRMRSASWLVGNGLLGKAVSRALDERPMTEHVRWLDDDAALADLIRGLNRLFSSDSDQYTIYWCAGSGVTSTGAEVLRREHALFERFLGVLTMQNPTKLSCTTVFLASSVGGAYAGATDPPFTEASPTAPASPYGEAKLGMERALVRAASESGLRGFVGRITNLYGPGQRLGKKQGLISVICETYVRREPATVYVSLDTLRDYIYEDDCAGVVVTGTCRAAALPAGSVTTKIIGAGTALSIGELIGTITRVARKRPLIAFGAGNSIGQAPDLRIRSEVWSDLDSLRETSLPTGISNVLRSLRATAANP